MRLIVGISGASGVLMGYRLLQVLQQMENCETHLVISESAADNFEHEMGMDYHQIIALADHYHAIHNMAASISSGSFKTDGMIICPCSMKTLSAVANGFEVNLLIRAAGVCLKESRRVVLVPREMPMSSIHIRNMLTAATSGCVIVPPMLTFYNHAATLEAQVTHVLGKVLMQFGLDMPRFVPWEGV